MKKVIKLVVIVFLIVLAYFLGKKHGNDKDCKGKQEKISDSFNELNLEGEAEEPKRDTYFDIYFNDNV